MIQVFRNFCKMVAELCCRREEDTPIYVVQNDPVTFAVTSASLAVIPVFGMVVR